jgi:hypothetical protein
MSDDQYIRVISEIESTITRASNARVSPSIILGGRLARTNTYEVKSGATEDRLVLLSKPEGSDTRVLAAVLPGGQLAEPLANVAAFPWRPIRRVALLGRSAIIEVPVSINGVSDKDVVQIARIHCKALVANRLQADRVRKRATDAKSVFQPCLGLYDQFHLDNPEQSRLAHLTDHLLGARSDTAAIVGQRADAKHGGDLASRALSAVNSMRRSAGTNYQGLVALGIAEDLLERKSAWYLHYPPPQEYLQRLALRFTPKPGLDVEIDPDIDILLRNAAWTDESTGDEPIVMLSVKTSLADRAGSAARWKMYFDVATHSCPFDGKMDGCAWHEQGLRFARPDLKVRLQHCIVTANIYKMASDARFADEGELGTAQTKANTFMFDQRYATRTGPNVQMDNWDPLTKLPDLLSQLSDEKGLPH